jgi:hypothetical protein
VTTEAEFAAALSKALGPLYRVSVASPDGLVEASFGAVERGRNRRIDIPLPGSQRSLVLEVDVRSLEAAGRVLEALAASGQPPEAPSGSFTHLEEALDELIAMAESHIGRPISQMSRADKQQVVRFLDDRGAFALRKAVETVAEALGVSRFTVYNYLDSARNQ